MEPPFAAILRRCAAGETPVNIALMHLLMNAADPAEIDRALAAHQADDGPDGADRITALVDLWRQNPGAWTIVRSVMAQAGGTRPDGADWAGVFDRLAASAPEAGVALYGLGSSDLLADATAEVVAFLRQVAPTGRDRSLLEIGCGYGRLSLALAGDFGAGLGLDVSAGMIAEAHRRGAAFPHLRFETTAGRDLSAVPAGSANLVLAADVFPYLVESGPSVARAHVADAGRILRPGGLVAIFNYSYRGDDALDRAEMESAFAAAGLRAEELGRRPFRLWDATAYLGRKP